MLIPILKEGLEAWRQDGSSPDDSHPCQSEYRINFLRSVKEIKMGFLKAEALSSSSIQQSKSDKIVPILEFIKEILTTNSKDDLTLNSKKYFCLVVDYFSTTGATRTYDSERLLY